MNDTKQVPLEPTEEMIEAGWVAISGNGGEGDDDALRSDALVTYKAMLAAAPVSGECDHIRKLEAFRDEVMGIYKRAYLRVEAAILPQGYISCSDADRLKQAGDVLKIAEAELQSIHAKHFPPKEQSDSDTLFG